VAAQLAASAAPCEMPLVFRIDSEVEDSAHADLMGKR
jgi:hypothetical protein